MTIMRTTTTRTAMERVITIGWHETQPHRPHDRLWAGGVRRRRESFGRVEPRRMTRLHLCGSYPPQVNLVRLKSKGRTVLSVVTSELLLHGLFVRVHQVGEVFVQQLFFAFDTTRPFGYPFHHHRRTSTQSALRVGRNKHLCNNRAWLGSDGRHISTLIS